MSENHRSPGLEMARRRTAMTRGLLPATLLYTVLCAGCGLSADPIDSQVADADTGAPIQGAVVVADWELHQGSLGGDALPCGAANVEEAVTDHDGKFHLPGWGPTRRSCGGDMRDGDPMFYVFKSGYHPLVVSNGDGSINTVTVTHSFWNGRQMKLRKFLDMDLKKASGGSYAAEFDLFNTDLISFTAEMPGQCNWKKMPRMIAAINQDAQQIWLAESHQVATFVTQLTTNDRWIQQVAPQCGSPSAYIEGLLK